VKRLSEYWEHIVKKVKGNVGFEFARANRPKPKMMAPPTKFPPVPEPKARPKDRYTVLVLGEAGRSSQLDLSRSRLKVLVLSGGLAVIVVVAMVFALPRFFSGPGQNTVQTSTQLDSTVQKDAQASKMQEQTKAASSSTQKPQTVKPIGLETGDSGSQTAGLAVPAPEIPSQLKPIDPGAVKPTDSTSSSATGSGEQQAEKRLAKKTPAATETTVPEKNSTPPPPSDPFIMNFDAQQVTATVDSTNSGTLSFRLVKDQPDTKFAGYLFVYVEMEDAAGENRIYVYPKQTRLGEGDLPFDFRAGEIIAFKFHSRVELPYGDPRTGASLAGVSILVYGENGKIVFQRTFGRQEVALVNTKGSKAERAKPRTGEKRQAL